MAACSSHAGDTTFMKKIILAILILAVLIAGGVNYFSRRAPDMLRRSIERSLDKTVKIQNIEFNFPWNFELSGVEIRDNREPFKGEVCFAVDKVHLEVSPLSLSQKDLIISRMEVEEATIVIRNRGGKLYHALSDAMLSKPALSGRSEESVHAVSAAALPLEIHQFRLAGGKFQFLDYDVQSGGFVIALDHIQAVVNDIHLPSQDKKTFYRVEAQLPQGRGQKSAELKMSGWTVFSDYDTDSIGTVSNLYLPFFEPYLAQVTPAKIQDGYLTSRSSIRIDKKDLTANVDFEMNGLYFQSYEDGEQLFGLKAEEILAFLKDVAGRLKFQIVMQWNIADPHIKKRDVIRRSIERSLKKTVLGNVGNLLEDTLKKIGDRGIDASKEDWEGALKKVKELFR